MHLKRSDGSMNAAPYFMLGGAQLAVGAAAIFARWALTGALPLAVSAGRLCIASIVLLLVARIRGETEATTRRERVILVAAGVFLALHFAGWVWSLEYTSVAVSTLLVTTTPIWTALYDSAFRSKHLSPLAWSAFGVGAIGLALIVGFNRTAPPVAGHSPIGAVLALVGAFAIGAYWILIREVRDSLSTRTIVTNTYSWAAIALVLAAFVARQPAPNVHNGIAWGGILAMAILSQLLGHTALNAALRWFSPSAIAFTTVIEPVIAALLALAIFHEALTPAGLVGGVLVLAAIAVVLREETRTAASGVAAA
ncbi:MAG: DMT family transporter [Candidatus Eremiobacteraeota bacterium]|nr:DMT family transporter [Candidatus Eremiobacteraeota bacterium]